MIDVSSFSFYIHLFIVGGAVESGMFVIGGEGFLGIVDRGFVLPGGDGEEDMVAVGICVFVGGLADEAGEGVQELLGGLHACHEVRSVGCGDDDLVDKYGVVIHKGKISA